MRVAFGTHNKTKDIEAIENVQRRATKMLPDMKDLTYETKI